MCQWCKFYTARGLILCTLNSGDDPNVMRLEYCTIVVGPKQEISAGQQTGIFQRSSRYATEIRRTVVVRRGARWVSSSGSIHELIPSLRHSPHSSVIAKPSRKV